MDYLVTEHVGKHYSGHTALTDVSMAVPEGKIFGLLGPNGAGKTTLIRIINQIILLDEGNIFINGEKLNPRHIYQIGYLPEERGLYKKMKVGEQALYLAQLKGLSRREALKRLKYWFEKFEIQDWWGKKIEELSKGMQQKVQFIVTVLHKPKLLIFDEPFSGFDPINANLLKEEILKIKEEGSTIIFSTHNMSSVEEICDNIALINKSRKILEGPIDEVRNQYKTNIFEMGLRSKVGNPEERIKAHYDILESKPYADYMVYKIKTNSEAFNANTVIRKMLDIGDLVSFKELIPSMNDVFIQAVNNEN